MISQSELPSSLNIPSLIPSSLVLAKYLWPPLPPAPQLFTTPWAGAVGSLIDSTFFFSTPYYSSSTFNSSFFICFSIQHVIFQKTTFSIECHFHRDWKFCIWNYCYAAKMIILSPTWRYFAKIATSCPLNGSGDSCKERNLVLKRQLWKEKPLLSYLMNLVLK